MHLIFTKSVKSGNGAKVKIVMFIICRSCYLSKRFRSPADNDVCSVVRMGIRYRALYTWFMGRNDQNVPAATSRRRNVYFTAYHHFLLLCEHIFRLIMFTSPVNGTCWRDSVIAPSSLSSALRLLFPHAHRRK